MGKRVRRNTLSPPEWLLAQSLSTGPRGHSRRNDVNLTLSDPRVFVPQNLHFAQNGARPHPRRRRLTRGSNHLVQPAHGGAVAGVPERLELVVPRFTEQLVDLVEQ